MNYYSNNDSTFKFKYDVELPSNNKLVKNDLRDLDELIKNNFVYDGMPVYVKSTSSLYIYDKETNKWIRLIKTEDKGNIKINGSLENGNSVKANGNYSHAEGLNTIANEDYQHVTGKWNTNNQDALFIVGNGTDENNRSNALEILKNGSIYAKGINLLDTIYNTYQSKKFINSVAIYTDSGADTVPFKNIIINRNNTNTSYRYITLRHLRKNLFNPDENSFVRQKTISTDGTISDSPSYAYSKNFLPVLPETDYVFSGDIISSNIYNSVCFYDINKNFILKQSKEIGIPQQFTTPSNCYFIRFIISNSRVPKLVESEAMLEVGTVASEYEAYTEINYISDFGEEKNYKIVNLLTGDGIDFDELQITCNPITPNTLSGYNYFFIVNGTLENDNIGDTTIINSEIRINKNTDDPSDKLPEVPQENGTYVLTATRINNNVTYSWIGVYDGEVSTEIPV